MLLEFRRAGRIQVTLWSKLLDVSLMVALSQMPTDGNRLWVTCSLVAVQLVRSVGDIRSQFPGLSNHLSRGTYRLLPTR